MMALAWNVQKTGDVMHLQLVANDLTTLGRYIDKMGDVVFTCFNGHSINFCGNDAFPLSNFSVSFFGWHILDINYVYIHIIMYINLCDIR